MKVKVYLRVAKSRGPKGFKVAAATSPNYAPLMVGSGWQERPAPTAAFALMLDVPDEIFRHAEQVLAEVELRPDDVRVAAEIAADDES